MKDSRQELTVEIMEKVAGGMIPDYGYHGPNQDWAEDYTLPDHYNSQNLNWGCAGIAP